MLLSAEHISLNFGLKPLLDDVTLYLSQGDKVGLIGINGTGKSSFLRVLAGQQPPDQGSVTRDPNVQVCFLPQNPPMEAGATVLEQVFLHFPAEFRELNEYEAKAMLNRLGITDFTQKVGTLSGGERQRISIARALLKDAPVILLDEATASLDVENESAVQEALSRLLAGKTVLVIAHRMRTVEAADKIVVLSEGRVTEQGTPSELMKQSGLFRHMVELQRQSAGWRLK